MLTWLVETVVVVLERLDTCQMLEVRVDKPRLLLLLLLGLLLLLLMVTLAWRLGIAAPSLY